MARTPVVYDVNVLVYAALENGGDLYDWPRLPARTKNPSADCVGVVNDNRDFALWLSPHILRNTRRVLAEEYGVEQEKVEEYITVLMEIAKGSGGGIIDPPRKVDVIADHEDNLILDLAVASKAPVIVTRDKDLLDALPWKAISAIHPLKFASRVDAARRHQRSAPTASTTQKMRDHVALTAQDTGPAVAGGNPAPVERSGHEQENFRAERAVFERRIGRLTEIVDGWGAPTAKTKPRLEAWQRNLLHLKEHARAIDALVTTQPDLAQRRLTAVNTKLGVELERLEQHLAPAARRPLANPRARPDTTPHHVAEADPNPRDRELDGP